MILLEFGLSTLPFSSDQIMSNLGVAHYFTQLRADQPKHKS